MEQAMGSATTTTTPADQVDDLIKAVADEAGLEISAQLASVPTGKKILSIYKEIQKSIISILSLLILQSYFSIIISGTIGESTSQAATVADDPLGRRLAALRE